MQVSEAAKRATNNILYSLGFWPRVWRVRAIETHIQSEIDFMQEQHQQELNQVLRSAAEASLGRIAAEQEAAEANACAIERGERVKELEKKLRHKDDAMDSYAADIRRMRLELADKENQLQELAKQRDLWRGDYLRAAQDGSSRTTIEHLQARCEDLYEQLYLGAEDYKKRTARLEAELEQMRKLLVDSETQRTRQVFIGIDPAADGLDELGITFVRKRKD